MSFRYTNSLIGVMKYRLLLESAHREMLFKYSNNKHLFFGICNGIKVEVNPYGTVQSITMVDKEKWESFYHASHQQPAAEQKNAALDYGKIAKSIKVALYECIEKIKKEKEESHRHALQHLRNDTSLFFDINNNYMNGENSLHMWYAQDSNSLPPKPRDGLMAELGGPELQRLRLGIAPRGGKEGEGKKGEQQGVLAAEDTHPSNIPLGSVHPVFTAGLLMYEDSNNVKPSSTVLREYKKEMNRDEQLFWERVELIRKGQEGSISNGTTVLKKRGYADMATTIVEDASEEKVVLKFTS